MKRVIFIALAFVLAVPLGAQDAGTFAVQADGFTHDAAIRYISDTTTITRSYADINDYDLLGVNFGVTFSQMMFNPPQKQEWLFNPFYASVTYTHYLKMFDYMPYFGFKFGLAYGREGYKFKPNKETGTTYKIDGATQARMEVVEVPFLSHFHFDALHFKIMVDAGIYGGYRLSIVRTGPSVTTGLEKAFASTDIRPDYGLQGGLGFGLVFSPVEFHVNALVRYSWSSIYTPDSSPSAYNQYYYRFAYPLDVSIMAGVHFQLTKRTGRTTRDLKKMARDIVENGWSIDDEDTQGKDRR